MNGANHRSFRLTFGGAPVYIVRSDDNFFDKPVPAAADGVRISPGERADIIVDFSNFAGQKITVQNTDGYIEVPLPEIMQFRVSAELKRPDTSCDPENPDPENGVCARKYPLVRLTDGKGRVMAGVKVDKVRQMVFYDAVVNGTPPDISRSSSTTPTGTD